MNKKELIYELKRLLAKPSEIEGSDYNYGHNYGIRRAIIIAKQLDESEKPVVPQFVADWYEEHKDNFEFYLSELCRNFTFNRERLNDKLANWYEQLENKPIQTLVNMHQFGYEIKKEKLYTVEIPNPNSAGGKLVLSKQQSTGRLILEMLNSDINKPRYLHLTEDEIKKDFGWAWQFAKEVEK